jgi:hypothetical protein
MSIVIIGKMSHIEKNFVKAVDQAANCTMNNCFRQHASDINYSIIRLIQRITQRRGGLCLTLFKEGATS